ncbi:MAG: hypothetical protein U0P81_01230 [Holophagaceae bacterium]
MLPERPRLVPVAFPALALLLAAGCGGSGGSTSQPAASVSAAEALRLTETFLQVEGRQSQPGYFPAAPLAPGDRGSAARAASALAAGTCGDVTIDYPTPTTMRITVDFAGCPKEITDHISGRLVITIGLGANPSWLVDYQALRAASGTESWTINGMKGLLKDTTRQEASIQTQNLSVAYADSAKPGEARSYMFNAALTGSWATAGQYRIWGTYSLTSSQDGSVSATVAKEDPLTYAAGCCYPSSGSIRYTRNGAGATATFLAPCGTVRIQPDGGTAETRALAACQ